MKWPKPWRRNTGSAAAMPFSTPLTLMSIMRVPVIDFEIVEQRDRRDAGIADQDVEPAILLHCQGDEARQIIATPHVRGGRYRRAARCRNAAGECLQPVRATCAEHQAAATCRQQQRGRLADPAARTGDRHYFVFEP